MSTDNAAKWLSFITNIGVIIGLVLVAMELRQNSVLMKVQISQARADSAMTSLEQFFNSDYMPPILAKLQRNEELSTEEWLRFVDYFRSRNRNQDNVLNQYDAGMLGENTPRSVSDYACGFVGASDRHLEAWRLTRPGYTDRYIDFIERALKVCG